MDGLKAKFGAGMAWLYALLTIGVVFGLSKLGLGGMVSLIATAGVFLIFAFLGAFSTKAGAGHVIAAMVVALIGVTAIQMFMLGSAVAGVGAGLAKAGAAAAVAAAGSDAIGAQAAGMAAAATAKSGIGGIIDLVVNGWKPLAGAFAASVVGAIIGSKMKGDAK